MEVTNRNRNDAGENIVGSLEMSPFFSSIVPHLEDFFRSNVLLSVVVGFLCSGLFSA